MFFLGLLSTPLPYLLLAGFYFFGFAMGMFNNSTGDETVETIAAVSIPVEVQQKAVGQSTFYYQISTSQNHIQTEILKTEENTSPFFPDPGTTIFQFTNSSIYEFWHSGFHFSRPPPFTC